MAEIEKTLGKKIKQLRKKNLVSVSELSKMFSTINYPISIKTIYKWESGENIPDLRTLVQLTYFFNTSMSYFIDNYKSCQALTESELEFISKIRISKSYRKIITLIAKSEKEDDFNE